MEDIVAVARELGNGSRLYVLTWGRIQDAVDPAPLEQLVFEQSVNRVFGEKLVRARCAALCKKPRRKRISMSIFSARARRKSPLATIIAAGEQKWTRKCRTAKNYTQ